VFISVEEHDKPRVAELARKFVDMGFGLVATHGTAAVLQKAGMEVERVFKVNEGRPNAVDLIKGQRIQLIINTPHGAEPWFDEKAIRRAAIGGRVPTMSTLSAAFAAAEGISALRRGAITVRSLQELHADIAAAEVR
jgi:carbamoyl-phosphate synthase large subunit